METPLPLALRLALRRSGVRPTRFLLLVSVARQTMWLWVQAPRPLNPAPFPPYRLRKRFLISTSGFGIGQRRHSNCTPLGLHRIAVKVGGGHPIGTIFRNRQPAGLTWQGHPHAAIVHRILWLEGLEDGFNRGGEVDTFQRYIYIHGFGQESTLGRPNSHGCIHLAAADLIPLFDLLPARTLVWIAAQ